MDQRCCYPEHHKRQMTVTPPPLPQVHLPSSLLYGIGYLGAALASITRGFWLFKWKVGGDEAES